MDITKADKNFIVKTEIEQEGLKFYDAEDAPFTIYGVFREGEFFRRIAEKLAKSVNDGVELLHTNTAGGRVRFKTNSDFIAIKAEMGSVSRFSHMPLTGTSGFDLYEKVGNEHIYRRTFVPPFDMETGYEGIQYLEPGKMRDITINFPLYNNVQKLYIGLDENAVLLPCDEYTVEKPVVYYGSSITQGGCASKPGSCYQAILTQELDINHINLGFSGSAKGEQVMAEYIADLDMSVFVMDYDHNATSPEYLESTHESFFKTVRRNNPNLPIIILPAPGYTGWNNAPASDVWSGRENIVRKTYENAITNGDKNVYFISGNDLMDKVSYNCSVDDIHPTDSGFWNMAQTLKPLLKQILHI